MYLQDPDEGPGYLDMADAKPSLLLEGDPSLLLDEWQMAPVIWDAVRFAVDKRGLMGQFILTGSATPGDNEISHSGTGRIARMIMLPMSLSESQESLCARDLRVYSQLIDGGIFHYRDKSELECDLMVLTGRQVAYRRPDGVLVVPIGCLKD